MKLDRRKKYYKVIRQDGKHYGMQYKEGLNVNVEPFNDNPEDECCPGRIYITNKRYVYLFYSYGDIVWEIKVPKDIKWMGEDHKIGVDKLILKNPIPVWKWIMKNTEDDVFWYLTCYCSKYFDKWWPEVKDKYPDEELWHLSRYGSEYFDKWWPVIKDRWPDDVLWRLAYSCSKDLHKWWPDVKDRYPDKELWVLDKYCARHPKVQEFLKKKGYIK